MDARLRRAYTATGAGGAQRLSATLMDAHPGGSPTDDLNTCSTPFGDIDGCTTISDVNAHFQQMCSTPFGDIDGCTCSRCSARDVPSTCAQRLSATLMDAHTSASATIAILDLCSTPFGDIDGCTLSFSVIRAPPGCAQRLSATLMDARWIRTYPASIGRCSTPFGDIDGCTGR